MSKKNIISLIVGLIFGLLLCSAIIELSIRITKFIFLFSQEQRNIFSISQKGTYRILCLGSSTTAFGGKDSYPNQLEEILNKRNIGVKFAVINKGVPGSDLSYILGQLDINLNKYNPNMTIIMIDESYDYGYKESNMFAQAENLNTKKQIFEKRISDNNLSFLNNFRIYRLAKTIWRSFINKKPAISLRESRDESDRINILQIEERLKKAIELNPGNYLEYFKLGRFYNDQRNFAEAEKYFNKVIELNPGNNSIYVELGLLSHKQGNLVQAEEYYRKAIELNPTDVVVYSLLGGCYREENKLTEAEMTYKKAEALCPNNYSVYFELGRFYKDQGNFIEAEKYFKKVIELNPNYYIAYFELGGFYKDQGNFAEAEAYYKKVVELTPTDQNIYNALGRLYEEIGDFKKAEECERDFKKAQQFNLKLYGSEMRDILQKIKKSLNKRGITPVYISHPMRSIEPVKKLLNDQKGIFFIDNEEIFKKAVKQDGFTVYFIDDHGHCTQKGNRLLAENIANTVVKEVFHLK